MRISLRIEYSALTLPVNTLGTCMAAQNNFGIESVPDHFFGAGAYTASDNDLHQKIGLARKTTLLHRELHHTCQYQDS